MASEISETLARFRFNPVRSSRNPAPNVSAVVDLFIYHAGDRATLSTFLFRAHTLMDHAGPFRSSGVGVFEPPLVRRGDHSTGARTVRDHASARLVVNAGKRFENIFRPNLDGRRARITTSHRSFLEHVEKYGHGCPPLPHPGSRVDYAARLITII